MLRRATQRGKLCGATREARLHDIEDETAAETARDRGLLRGVGTWGLTASIVNGVVGAGIFGLPAKMAAAAGAYAPLAYVACAIAMGAIVICFATAGSRLPTSGGVYGTVEAAFGPLTGFVVGVLLWVSSVLACGGISAFLADEVAVLLPGAPAELLRVAVIVLVVAGFACLNISGVARTARAIAIFTPVKLVPLGLFLLIGAAALISGGGAGPVVSTGGGGFGRAIIVALFAFSGMETPLGASGEVAAPTRTVPRAILLSMGFVLVLYVAIQIVAQGLLGPALAGSAAPLAVGLARVDPRLGQLVLIGTILSLFGWIASDLLGAPRFLFAFGRDGRLPAVFGTLHPVHRTPAFAIWVHAGLVMLLALTGTFEQLAVLSMLAGAALYFLACAAAWRLEARGVALFGAPLRVPALPVIAIVGMASMVGLILLAEPIEIAGLVAVIVASLLIYPLGRARPA